jgi:hypothetical protein
MEVSMDYETALWNELSGIYLADDATDNLFAAYQSGDLTEMGRIIASHINLQMSSRHERKAAYDRRIAEGERRGCAYELTDKGNAQVHPEFQNILARFQGGTL